MFIENKIKNDWIKIKLPPEQNKKIKTENPKQKS
jgi:hypothetical protein